MVVVDICKHLSFGAFLINAPIVPTEHVNILDSGMAKNQEMSSTTLATTYVPNMPMLPLQDDEEAEGVEASIADDEELSEKPHKKKKKAYPA